MKNINETRREKKRRRRRKTSVTPLFLTSINDPFLLVLFLRYRKKQFHV
jgi:hypothetical protein